MNYTFVFLSCVLLFAVCYAEVKRCENPLPAAEYLQYGYDLAEFDIYGCPEIGGKRAQIAAFNECRNVRRYRPPLVPDVTYDIPDGIGHASVATLGALSFERTYSNFIDFIGDSMKDTVSQSFDRTFMDFSNSMLTNSKFFADMRKPFVKRSSIAISYRSSTFLHMVPSLFIENYTTPEFRSDVEALPAKFNGSEKQYLDFIHKYGTHIFEGAHFGGIIIRMKEVRRNETNDIWKMSKNFPILNDTIEVMCEKKDGPFRVQVVRSKERDFVQYMLGGWADYNYFHNKDYEQKLNDKPVLVSVETMPLSKLVNDLGHTNKTLLVDDAIELHMAQSNLKSSVKMVKNLLDSGLTYTDKIRELMKEYEQLKNSYDIRQLTLLANHFNKEVDNFEKN